MVKNIPNKYT